jgi:uncharacterized protein YcbK (DUF882 family)
MITDASQWKPGRWPHFQPREFACKGTGALLVDPALLDILEALRAAVGRPLPVTSGYRAPSYNRRISPTGDTGPHTTGRAVDIAIEGAAALALVGHAIRLGVTGIGVQQKGTARFIHLDLLAAPDYPRPALWSY